MKEQLEAIRAKALEAVALTQAGSELEAVRVQYLGKKGELTAVLKQMGKLSPEERPVMGQLANEVRAELEKAIEAQAAVLAEKDGAPVMTVHPFGKGKAAYLSSFREGPESNRMLLELLMYLSGAKAEYVSDSALVEAAYYPADRTLVALNNSEEPVSATIAMPGGSLDVTLNPMETRMIQL